uniref:Uncharacterized protein n=1 Tax=Sinocyclocheilus anshuiensis TaxID=1608454 RepID=A0A671R0W1_9TELE
MGHRFTFLPLLSSLKILSSSEQSHCGCSHESGVVRQAFLLVQQRLLDEKVDVAVLVLVQPLFWNNLCVALVSDNDYVYVAYNKNVTESL